MIHFYGAPNSSAGRTHLMLEECGIPYEYHRVNTRDPADANRAELRKLYPTGKIPFLVDGDIKIGESVAINFYLAEKYAPQLWAESLGDRTRIYAWSLWGITNLQTECQRFMRHTMQLPADKRSASEAEAGKTGVQRYFDELEQMLPESGYLVGGKFSVADINVGSVVNLALAFQCGALGARSNAWFETIRNRPAWKKVAAAT